MKTTEETDPEVPWISELANEIVIITMSKDIKENLFSLHEKKDNFNREIKTILKRTKQIINN